MPPEGRKLTRRLFVASSLGATAAALVAACGGPAPTPTVAPTAKPAAAPTTAPAPTSAPAATAKPAAAGPALVVYATQNSAPPTSLSEQQIVNDFEAKQSNIKVKVQFWPGQDVHDKLRILAAANQMPDAVDIETKQLPDFVFRKMVFDITDMVKAAGIKQDDYWPNQWAKHHIKGKMWAFPLDSQDVVIFYNKGVFDKAGVPYPPKDWNDPSWTYDKLVEIGTKLTTGSGATKVWGYNTSTWWVYSYPIVWSWGGSVLNAERTKSTITNPDTVDAYQFRADLINKYKIHPTPADQTEGIQSMFQSGRLAMHATWSPWAYVIKDAKGLSFDMAPMPKGKAGAFTRGPSDCIALGAQGKNQEPAFQFAKYLCGPEGLKEMDITAGLGIPPLKALAEAFTKPQVKGIENLNWKMVLDSEAIPTVKLQDVTVKFPEMDKTIDAEHQVLLSGKETAKEFAANLDPKLNALLDSIPEEARGYIGD